MLWPTLTIATTAFAILFGLRTHPHTVAHPDPVPPAPASLTSSAWASDAVQNLDLGDVGGFLAKGKIHFAETAFVKDSEGCDAVYASDNRGRVWALAPPRAAEQDPRIVAHVGGTVLGAAFDADGGMYLADATRGLLYLASADIGRPGRARIVASMAPSGLQEATGEARLDQTELRYTNDIAIDSATGFVYFTDSSRISPTVDTARRGDTLASYGDSHLTGDASGRLVMYDPSTDETHVLVTGIPFANGVGILKGGSHVVFVSTSTYSVRKVPTVPAGFAAVGPPVEFKDAELFYNGALAGLPDGLTVDQEDGSVFVAMFAPTPPSLRLADGAPKWLRKVIVSLPLSFRPTPKSVHAVIAKIDANGTVAQVWIDKKRQFGMLSSVARCGKYLYCGCLSGSHAAWFDVTL